MVDDMQLVLKDVLDRTLAIILLVILAPVWLGIMIAIRLDDGGPVLFRQERLGKNGQLFQIFKFRTMIVNADQFLDESGRVTNQNRVTKVGKLLRLLSLDELPQLINILIGNMSIIGPRPVLPGNMLRFTNEQKRRLLVKPGVTGLAQVNGRNTLKWSRRIEYDIWYVDHYSLLLDAMIFLKTIKVVLLREGIVVDRNIDEVDDLPFH